MASPLLPEFFALFGIDLFLALSLLACLLDKHFPSAVPYVYQFAALFGFGHLLVSRGFMSTFGVEMRFWYCIVYLLVAVANVIAVNIYMAVIKKLSILSKVFSGAITFPTILVSVFFVSSFSNGIPLPFPMLPVIPMQIVYVVLVLGAAVLGVGIMMSLKPAVLGKHRFRQPAEEVRAVTDVSKEASERTVGSREVSQAGEPKQVTSEGIRLSPEQLRQTKDKRR